MSDQDLPKGLWEWSSGEGLRPWLEGRSAAPSHPCVPIFPGEPVVVCGARDSAAQGSSLRALL